MSSMSEKNVVAPFTSFSVISRGVERSVLLSFCTGDPFAFLRIEGRIRCLRLAWER